MPELLIVSPGRVKTVAFCDVGSEAFREAVFACLCAHERTQELAGDALLDAVRRGEVSGPMWVDVARLLEWRGVFALHVQVAGNQPVTLSEYLSGVTAVEAGCGACGAPGSPGAGAVCANCHGEHAALYYRAAFLECSGPVGSGRAFGAYMTGSDLAGTLEDELRRAQVQGRSVPVAWRDVGALLSGAECPDRQVRELIDFLRRGR